jgi:hypothetical protein
MMANSSNLNTHSVLGYFQPSLTGLVGLVLKPRISSWAWSFYIFSSGGRLN